MPRTRRYIFNTLTVVSVVLMLATVALWVDSVWHLQNIRYNSSGSFVYVTSVDHQTFVGLSQDAGIQQVGL